MAAWWIPALKAILPHVGTVISATAPVFTRKTPEREGDAAPPEAAPNPHVLMQQQIAELQAAASQNVADTKQLAAQLQGMVQTLEQAASTADAKLQRALQFAIGAGALAAIALVAALVALFSR
jgi:hypothetical protein